MRPTSLLTFLFAIGAYATPAPITVPQFLSCDAANIAKASKAGDPLLLMAKCKGNDDRTRCTQLDLNKCIAFRDGSLVAADNGKFSSSIQDCKLHGKGETLLQCTGHGDEKYKIDLKSIVEPKGGDFSCFGHVGGPCP